jgi:hypothetical protein
MNEDALFWVNSDPLIEWLNKFFGKKPLVSIYNSRQWLNKFPKDLHKTSLNRVSVFSWVIGDLDLLVIADEVMSLVDGAVLVC